MVHLPLKCSIRALLNSGLKSICQSQASFHSTSHCRTLSATPFVHDDGSRLEVRGARWPRSLHLPHVWLRDHCRCPHCYSELTSQRTFNLASMPLAIRPCSYDLHEDTLHLTWPDGHASSYSLKFLWQTRHVAKHTDTRQAWTGTSCPPLTAITVPQESMLGGGPGLKTVVSNIEKYGLAIVNKVPADVPSTERVVTALAPVLRTFYGKMWALGVSTQEQFADSSYSNGYLGAHTDGTYFSQAPRLQVFHCLQAATTGGSTLLVDGLSVARKLQSKHPEAYHFFSTQPVTSEYLDSDRHHLSTHTILSHHPVTGLLQQIRYNLYDRAPLSSLPLAGVEQYYQHLHALAHLVESENGQFWLSLAPGSVLFIDNWRVMHGRAAFSGGNRILTGCYVSNEEYTGTARTLGLLHQHC